MGHIAHLRNQFKSLNTFAQSYDYIIILNWRGKKLIISFLIIERSLIICKTFSLAYACCYFVIISLWKRAWSVLHLNFNLFHPKLFWLKWAHWFWRRRCKCENFTTTTTTTTAKPTDNGQILIRKAFGSGELKG